MIDSSRACQGILFVQRVQELNILVGSHDYKPRVQAVEELVDQEAKTRSEQVRILQQGIIPASPSKP